MTEPSNLETGAPPVAPGRLRALVRNPSLVVPLWLAVTVCIALAVSHNTIGSTVDNMLRGEAERVARDWANYAAAMLPDIEKVASGYAPELRYDEILGSLQGTDRVFLFKLFDKTGALVLSSDKALHDQINAGVRSHNPDAARVVFSGRPHTLFFKNSRKPGRPEHYSEAYVPIMRDGSIVAVVEVYVDQTERYREHKSQELFLSAIVGTMVALSFGAPALFLLFRSRQVSSAEATIRDQNLQFKSAIDSMAEGLSLFDNFNRLVACNKRYREMYSLPEQLTLPGTHLRDMVFSAARSGLLSDPEQSLAQLSAQVLNAERGADNIWHLADGRIIAITISPLSNGGRISVHKDVTEERQAAARLAESETRFRDFASAAADWCWETNADHRFSYITDGFQAATGVAPKAVLGMRRGDAAVHPDDAAAIAAHAKELERRRPFRDFSIHIKRPDGNYAYIRSSGAPRFASDGTFLGYRGTARDVTAEEAQRKELQHAEKALRLRSAQLTEAQRLGKIGDWSYSLGASHVDWGPELFELLRFDSNLGRMDHAILMSHYIGDGAQKVLQCHKRIASTGEVGCVDVKYRRGDGTIVDVAVTSKALYGPDGRLTGFAGTIQDITERKTAEEQLKNLAFYDPLTGLANRALFSRTLDDVIADCARNGRKATLLLLDLDHFKEVNDSLGHSAGDELLVKAGQLIGRALGKSDFLARLGGDEFAIIASGCSSQEASEALARQVIEIVSGTIQLERGEVTIGTSVGIALVDGGGTTPTDLLRNADLALYRAKEDGRGRHAVFQPDMDAAVQHKVMVARELRRAITDDAGLTVHYQPQVNLEAGRVCSFEALVRWTHPTLGAIPPSQFIPIAESSQLIIDLGLWVLRQAAAQTKAWIDAGEAERRVSVNVSAAQIWHSDLVTDIARVLKETGVPPRLICLELTESLLVDHAEGRVRAVLKSLKQLGVVLALDDFGTGYSSLGYLTELPFDELKIDRIFVDGVAHSERSRELLKGIISLGHGLGMAVVAEGAEKAEEISILENLGCDLVQGYAIARPLPAADARMFANSFKGKPEDIPVHALQARLRAEVA